MTESTEKVEKIKVSETEIDNIDSVSLQDGGCNGSVIIFVSLLSLARVAHGFFWSVPGKRWKVFSNKIACEKYNSGNLVFEKINYTKGYHKLYQ